MHHTNSECFLTLVFIELLNIHGMTMKLREWFYCVTWREPCNLITVKTSVHVSFDAFTASQPRRPQLECLCTSYNFGALMPVVWKLWH